MPIKSRAQLKAQIATGQPANEATMTDRTDSFFHILEDPLGLRLFATDDPSPTPPDPVVSNRLYAEGECYVSRDGFLIFRTIVEAPIGTVMDDPAFFEGLPVDGLTEVDITDPSLTAAWNTLRNVPGAGVQLVRVQFADTNPKTAAFYVFDSATGVETLPYIINPTSGGGSWIACGGRYHQGAASISGDLFAGGDAAIGGELDLADNLTVGGSATVAEYHAAKGHHVAVWVAPTAPNELVGQPEEFYRPPSNVDVVFANIAGGVPIGVVLDSPDLLDSYARMIWVYNLNNTAATFELRDTDQATIIDSVSLPGAHYAQILIDPVAKSVIRGITAPVVV